MSRLVLVLALVLSLVPPAGISVWAATSVELDRSDARPARQAVEPRRPETSASPGPEQACAGLARLFVGAIEVNRELARTGQGRPPPRLRTRTVRLDESLRRWLRRGETRSSGLAGVARVLRSQLVATRALTGGPTPARLERFNRSVRRVNVARSRLVRRC